MLSWKYCWDTVQTMSTQLLHSPTNCRETTQIHQIIHSCCLSSCCTPGLVLGFYGIPRLHALIPRCVKQSLRTVLQAQFNFCQPLSGPSSGCEPLPSVAYILTIRSTHHHSWAIVRIARGGIEITNSSRGSWDDYNERTMKNMVDIVNRKVGSELNRKRCIGVLTE